MNPLLQTVLQQVDSIRIDTAYGPPIVMDHPFEPGSQPSEIGLILKPKITISAAGNEVTFTPYGEPGETKWPYVQAAAVFGVAAFGILLVQFFRRKQTASALSGHRRRALRSGRRSR